MLRFLLTSDSLPAYELETDPLGWDGLRYVFVRDPKYHGVTLEATTELTFVKKGADYLRTLYEARGIEAVAYLSVFEEDVNEFRSVLALRARVDFTTYSSGEQGASVSLKEEGMATKLLGREGIEIDLLRTETLDGRFVDGPDVQQLDLHSQALTLAYRAPVPGAVIPAPGISFVTNGESRFHFLYKKPTRLTSGLFSTAM